MPFFEILHVKEIPEIKEYFNFTNFLCLHSRNVANVPSEPKWSSPRKTHISCPADPSGASNTIAG